MIRESAKPVLFGTAIGLVFAWWGSAVFQSLLYRIDSRGPELYVVVAATLLVTAVAAAWLPARRAARTDPAVVLRSQQSVPTGLPDFLTSSAEHPEPPAFGPADSRPA